MEKRGFFILVLLLIIIPLVSSVPSPQTNINIQYGIQIETPGINVMEQNQPFDFEFHIFNITTGLPINNDTVVCNFHLYNDTGLHQFINPVMPYSSDGDFFQQLTANNFSNTGEYYYYIGCNNTLIGGFAREVFQITPTGNLLETSESNLYIIILISTFILFLAFLYPAIKLPYSNKINPDGSITKITKTKYLKLLSVWFAYGFLMWFLQTLNGISTSFIKLEYLSNFITNIFTYSQIFSVGITFLILIIIFIEIWKDIILSNTIKKYGKAYLDGRFQ